jgi:hypothetical protein
MDLKTFNDKYGKHVLIIGSLVIWLVIGLLFVFHGYEETWWLWRIPVDEPAFLDLRLIPGGAESFRAGYDPAVENPFDPRGRIFNYPKIWYLAFYTGIAQDDTTWLGVLLLVLFFLGVFSFPGKITVFDALLMLFVIFSSSSVMLYERMNVDIMIFALCALIVAVSGSHPGLAAGLLAFGAILKIFPLFGAGIFLKEDRGKFFRYLIVILLVFGIYIGLTLDSLKTAWSLTQRGSDLSYGLNVFVYHYQADLEAFFARWVSATQVDAVLRFGPYGLGALLFLIGLLAALRNRAMPDVISEKNLTAFRVGAFIYIGTFFIGNNWDYRLTFLIFAIPQLAQWLRSKSNAYRVVSVAALAAIFLSCWYMWIGFFDYSHFHGRFGKYIFDTDEFMNWLLVPLFTYLLSASAPQWAKEVFGRRPAQEAVGS